MGFGAGVRRSVLFVKTSDVTDAYGMGVMVFDVSTFLIQRSASVDASILIDDVVISTTIPFPGSVPPVNVSDGYPLTGFRGTAMDYNNADYSHGLVCEFV